MLEALREAWATPGLFWLIAAISIAGLVRGFTGFGTALIFLPVAGIFLPPAQGILILTLTGVATLFALVPRAWARAEKADVAVLSAAAIAVAPFGVALLAELNAVTVRWIVAGAAAFTLAALVLGWRYRREIGRTELSAVGAAAGFLGGLTGLTGPPVILFYLAGPRRAEIARANTILFLAALDIGILATFAWKGMIQGPGLALGAILILPYLLFAQAGQALFRPEAERLYRAAAYCVIGLAILAGLPVFD
jgi:hypothetical protein